MAKQIVNFELFTNKKEELTRIRRKQRRSRMRRRIFVILLLVLAAAVVYVISNSRSGYYSYKDAAKTEENTGVVYESFAEGFLKYSSSGIEYQKKFGVSEWNKALSLKSPFLETSDSYAVLGEKGGNILYLFKESGEAGEITLQYPVTRAVIADNGILVAILQDTDRNFIKVYDEKGNTVADVRATIDETGYPVSVAISPNGTKLAISYFTLNGLQAKTSVEFCDLSAQLSQGEDVKFVGSFDYESELIPKITFFNDTLLAAVSNQNIHYYNIENEPSEFNTIQCESEIQSVFGDSRYLGVVFDNSSKTGESKYRICLYDKKGSLKLDKKNLDMEYEEIAIWNRQIIAVKDNYLTILKTNGKLIFQEELEGGKIEAIFPSGGWRSYRVIFNDRTILLKLKFWE